MAAVGKMAPEAARTQAKILLGTIANGADPAMEKRASRPKPDQLTFDAFADKYIDEYAKGPRGEEAPRKKSWKNDVGYLKRCREQWGRLLAASITDDDVADLLDTIARMGFSRFNRCTTK
ncbi:hypothetical protein [Bradyrhizobium sp. BWA-3-5]|uniref:hypothetical protein n=1 Tax=Bradyrhizobium sp. BWA-3-5 TaxID=3080013 RepID=UPI00293EFDEA|nr:hypothetical protein [Bradyrhizobium sp. BWA-3-5]WOH64046.1 hypothetical protein RX331_25965 [Bradyrhizobium sp. BWA-3-5]WOH64172.1 hypothetical protein RX331_26755 [Bradyrhizobium sp. BWA-3-5]WOH70096.1 hypothetical protein RX331_37900 [Bradyrhizobium sp. BWA-3-5]